AANVIQFSLGGSPMDLPLFPSDLGCSENYPGCAARGECGGDNLCHGNWAGGVHQRTSWKVSEVLLVPGTCAVQQLFHDRNFPHAVQLPRLDLGSSESHGNFCPADLAGAASGFETNSTII